MKPKILFQLTCCAVVLCGCATNKDYAVQRNKEIIRRYFDGWGNRGDPAVADELIAPNVTLRNPPAILHSLEDYKKGMAVFHRAFPDLHFTIEDLIAEGDKAKMITVSGISLFRLAGGKIQEITVSMDRLGQAQQLGWLPATAPPAK